MLLLGSPTVLIAQMEGAANCTTTLKLKKDNTFVERVICFGITDFCINYQFLVLSFLKHRSYG
jgi:hypothetical protein